QLLDQRLRVPLELRERVDVRDVDPTPSLGEQTISRFMSSTAAWAFRPISRADRQRSDILRVHGGDAGVASEVRNVQGEEVRDAVPVHGGNKPRIVHLNVGDGMRHEQPAPLNVDRGTDGEEAVEL